MLNWIPDKTYVKLLFWIHFGYWPDIENPKSFNEKMQWLKIHDRKPEYNRLVDKYEVRSYIAQEIGKQYLIPILWEGNNFDEIDFNSLPNQFVIKCTHDSGSVKICNNKCNFDKKSARKFINDHLKTNLYWAGREWVYKDVPPRIIIEQFMGSNDVFPEDYKFYAFNGEIDCVMVCKGRENGYPKFYFYDMEWKRLRYLRDEPEDDAVCPENFKNMIKIVKKLSKDFPAIRIDLYDVKGNIYFGEFTFYNQSGYDLDITRETDLKWGKKLILPIRT